MWPTSTSALILLLLSTIATPTLANEIVTVTITAVQTATATATATTSPEIPQDPSYTSSSLFKSSVLSTTNDYRAEHNASALTWNDTLADYAKQWAKGCIWEHSHGPYGENLAYGYGNATTAVQVWGDERDMYDFDKPTGFTKETGHFTQLVWKGTTEVGCAAVDCGLSDPDDDEENGVQRAQGWYLVCEYAPAGNVVGGRGDGKEYYRLNVLAPVDNNGSGHEGEGEGEHEGQVWIEIEPGVWLWRLEGTGPAGVVLGSIGWRIGLWWVWTVVHISSTVY
ncbi:CAP domain-containing protein [Aspergillus germanicus]